MANKVGPNQPCPCGSGKKFKKCCALGGGGASTSAAFAPPIAPARELAMARLDAFVEQRFADEREDAFEEFWGRFIAEEPELPDGLRRASQVAEEAWFAFDRPLDDGRRPVDHLLDQPSLSAGERAWLTSMRDATTRMYEIIDLVPGVSLTLRDLLEGTVVRVHERSASRHLSRGDELTARVIPRGKSGQPELEIGVLGPYGLARAPIVAAVRRRRDEYLAREGATVDGFYKEMAPLFHEAWLTAIFEPMVPELHNSDGETTIATEVSFHVVDRARLRAALDAAPDLTGDGDAWGWSSEDGRTALGTLTMQNDLLVLETHSVERGARGREKIEARAGDAVRHRATVHADVRRQVQEALRAKMLGKEPVDEPLPEIDPELAEALVAQQLGRHYRSWIDEPVPALDGQTPRNAARDRAMRARVEELVRGLEGMYERSLKSGQPAYDPSWMWAELGLRSTDVETPPLAHDRVGQRVPGSREICRSVADRLRRANGAVLGEDDYATELELQRFARGEGASANDVGRGGSEAAPYLRLMTNFELHLRKAFHVDEALSFMLENTDFDLEARALHAPFPSCCLVLTDRHALSLGERLLARRPTDPLCGQILRVATVYVTERGGSLEVTFAFDALGADLPSLVRHDVPADDAARYLDTVAPRPPVVDPPVPDRSPVRALLRLVLNAILYATSAGVTPVERPETAPRPRVARESPAPPSDSVYFLPGTIDIRSVRKLQELQRAPEGRQLFSRFMVRGHWRKPQKGWTDQRLRWVEPYWKGPELATVIERAYRLKS